MDSPRPGPESETLSHEARLARFDAEIRKGIESADRGELKSVDQAFDELDAYIEELVRKNAA